MWGGVEEGEKGGRRWMVKRMMMIWNEGSLFFCRIDAIASGKNNMTILNHPLFSSYIVRVHATEAFSKSFESELIVHASTK
jgi:hypothetical protein